MIFIGNPYIENCTIEINTPSTKVLTCTLHQWWNMIFQKYVLLYYHTHLRKCQLAKNKELLIPPIWGCCGPTRGSFFTHRQIKNPASSEIAVKTHSRFGPHLANHFACVTPALKKGWIFYLPMGKKWTLSRSTTIPDRWYQKFFIFGQLALPMMCALK